MSFLLNQPASVRLNALIEEGKYLDGTAFEFSAEDSNALLGDQNWTEYGQWFLGTDSTQPKDSKAHYKYAFGKGKEASVAALRTISSTARTAGDGAIADYAVKCLDKIKAREADLAKASAVDLEINFDQSVIAIQASADDGPPKFSMNAYTGGAMNLKGWKYPVVVDLKGVGGIDRSRPVLLDHDTTQIVGHTTSILCADGCLKASGIISGSSDCARQVLMSGKQGFPWQASIGARVKANEFVPEGRSISVNGQTFDGPINVARQTVLGEISFVALGADDNTSARIAANKAAEGTHMEFAKWLEAKGFVLADLKDQQKQSLQAAYDAEVKAAADAADAEKKKKDAGTGGGTATITAESPDQEIQAKRKAMADENRRIAKIDQAAKGFPEIAAKAIEEGWSLEKVELEVLRAQRPQHGPYVNTGAGQDVTPDIIAAACAMSAGVSEKAATVGLNQQSKDILAGRKMRGIGLHEMMFMIAASAGIQHQHGRVDDDFIRAMFHHDQKIQAAGVGFSTMSLSGITENILNKAMLEAYNLVPSTVEEVCYQTDTNDFKQFKRYRLTASGSMLPVGPTGELKNMSLQDESYANQLTTQGCVITVTRNILINDDMGALVQIPQLIGQQAAITREKAVYTVILANAASFFGSGNKNYLSGGTSPLSITSLTSAVQKLLEMKNANSDFVMIMPDRLLIPPPLYATAQNLFNGANLVVTALGSTSAKETQPNFNQHAGKYRPIVSPWLGGQSPLTGNSDTGWYLLGNPTGGMAIAQIGYLRGQRTPVIERGETNFNTLGIALRGYYDFGVALLDYRTGIFSAGA